MKIVILNGTSSSGKSTLAKKLQETLDGEFLIVPIDAFIEMIPDNSFENKINGVVTAMAKTVKALVDEENNVIVDTVFYYPKLRCDEYEKLLEQHNIIFVKVLCSNIEELNKREADRKNRELGLAESQMNIVYDGYKFHVEIDTSKTSTEEAVSIIKDYVFGDKNT